jgi:hypothetical protein
MTDTDLRDLFQTRKVHCWYSNIDDRERGGVVYLIDGVERIVTNVSEVDNSEARRFNSPDATYVGMGTFVRRTERAIQKDKEHDHLWDAAIGWNDNYDESLNFDEFLKERSRRTQALIDYLEGLTTRHKRN